MKSNSQKLKKKISSSQKTEKKKKATAISEKAGKSIKIQATTCSEDADPTHPLCAGEKDGFSSSSRASEDRSAAVLARKEEIEQAYQRVLLNFAVVTAMLLETKPCMEAAMEAALRANLRRIGNYYECMLEDFIDSYDLANAI
nr:periphilin-1-like isoform X2 [Zootoca vivipara]